MKRGARHAGRVPGAKRQPNTRAKGLGDCIDCGLCVQVCPTGIDIREGLQYECISCSACIDACDGVMEKMHYPRGLIRNSTQNGITQKLTRPAMFRRVLRPRVLVYTAVLGVVSIAMLASLLLRASFRVDVVRDRGSIARMVGQGEIENVYRLQIMNATEHGQQYSLRVAGIEGAQIVSDATATVDAADSRWVPVRVRTRPGALTPGSHPIQFIVSTHGASPEQLTEKSVFLVPR